MATLGRERSAVRRRIHAQLASGFAADWLRAGQPAADLSTTAGVSMNKIIATLREMDELGCVLLNDAKHAEAHLQSDTARRHYVRAVFAYIEGLGFRLKRVVLARHASGLCKLLPPEIALLREESYDLDDKGVPHIRAAHLKLTRNLRFAFEQYAKAYGMAGTLAVDAPGWRALLAAAEIRNRLMHPKSVQDIEVTEDEAKVVKAALDWFTAEFVRLLGISVPGSRRSKPETPKRHMERFKRGHRVKGRDI